jgi:uncharacterized protein
MKREIRPGGERIEVRSDAGKPPKLVGYAARFNVTSELLGNFREQIAPGAFREALSNGDDPCALVDHQPSLILGRRSAGTLTLEEDAVGLKVTITPPNTQVARDLIENVRVGNLSGMSFAFAVAPGGDEWDTSVRPALRRVLRVAKIFDVSVTTYPAYTQTEVSLESRRQSDRQARLALIEWEIDANNRRQRQLDEAVRAVDPQAWRQERLRRAEAVTERYRVERSNELIRHATRLGIVVGQPGDPSARRGRWIE